MSCQKGSERVARGRIYNNFYTPELWEQVNTENKRILDDFLAEYRQRKKSKGTIEGYFQDLRIIFIYILKELIFLFRKNRIQSFLY